MGNATPRPWFYQRKNVATPWYLYGGPKWKKTANGQTHSCIGSVCDEANAALIVKAVNSHAALLAACKEIARFSGGSSPWTMQCAEIARAALAAAEAE